MVSATGRGILTNILMYKSLFRRLQKARWHFGTKIITEAALYAKVDVEPNWGEQNLARSSYLPCILYSKLTFTLGFVYHIAGPVYSP